MFPDDIAIPDQLAQRLGMVIAAALGLGFLLQLFLLARWKHFHRVWPRRVQRLVARPWQGNDVACVVAVVLALHLVGWLLVSLWKALFDTPAWLEMPGMLILHSIALHGGLLLSVWWLLRRRGCSWRRGFGPVPIRAPLMAIGFYLAVLPLLAVMALLYQWTLRRLGVELAPQDVLLLFADIESDWLFYYMAILAMVIAPISEELLFRGLLLPAMLRRVGPVAAILASSMLFAAIHFSLAALVPLFVFAVALNLAYIMTRSLVVPMLMHMLFNMVSLILIRTIAEYL